MITIEVLEGMSRRELTQTIAAMKKKQLIEVVNNYGIYVANISRTKTNEIIDMIFDIMEGKLEATEEDEKQLEKQSIRKKTITNPKDNKEVKTFMDNYKEGGAVRIIVGQSSIEKIREEMVESERSFNNLLKYVSPENNYGSSSMMKKMEKVLEGFKDYSLEVIETDLVDEFINYYNKTARKEFIDYRFAANIEESEELATKVEECNKTIKKMYKKLALQIHPDTNNGRDKVFRGLKEVYDDMVNEIDSFIIGGKKEYKKMIKKREDEEIRKEKNRKMEEEYKASREKTEKELKEVQENINKNSKASEELEELFKKVEDMYGIK